MSSSLINARTAPDILAALARALQPAKADCPDDAIPAEAALGEWMTAECPDHAQIESAKRLAAVLGGEPATPKQPGWEWAVVKLDFSEGIGSTGERICAIRGLPRLVIQGLPAVHALWLTAHKTALADGGEPPRHPLAPIVQAWQDRPRPAAIDRRETGIMPAPLIDRIAPGAIIQADPNHRLPAGLSLIPPDPAGTLWLPGMDPTINDIPAFLLAILDAGSAAQPGKGAPLRDRAFAEALMLAATQDRRGGGRFLLRGDDDGPLTIADAVEWMDWKRAGYRVDGASTGLALARALAAVNTIKIPLNNRGGWLLPAMFEAVEGRRLTDRIAVSVRLPPGSEHGARVDRRALRQAGKASAIAWRQYLALCFAWNWIAYRGRPPHLTRPELRRDPAGYLVDARGRTLADKRGRPQREGRNPRAVETGRREPNPAADRYPVYDNPAALVRLAFPLGSDANRNSPARTERQCVLAVRWLAGERDADGNPIILNRQTITAPAVRIERLGKPTRGNPDGFPWRIVPPWTQ